MLKIVQVKGPDAAEFLHRVTAGTVRGLADGQGRGGLLFNGQSRVLAQFDLLRRGRDEYWLAAPRECADALGAELERLHFAEDLAVSPGLAASAEAAPVENRGEPFPVGADFWPSPVSGFQFRLGSSALPPPGWDFARIGALLPWPARDWELGATPALEAGLLRWIDRDKGCYPGQEVVELSLNVGHPARLLLAFEGQGEGWNGEGAVTSEALQDGLWRGFVRVPWALREILPPGIFRLGLALE